VSRILLVYQPVDGGVGRHLLDLSQGLTQLGYEAVLCGPAVPGGSVARSGAADRPSQTAAAVPAARHVPLAMGRAIKPGGDLVALGGFAKVVRSIKPDLIHAHSSKAGAVARLGKLLNPRIPVTYTPHGYAFAGFFEHELERLAYREAERLLAPLTGRVIAVCEAEARLAAEVCPSSRVRVVHNGIDAGPGAPPDERTRALAANGPVLCTVTQLRPGKGVETLIDALPAVAARHPTVQLVIVGDGPLRGALESRTRMRGVDQLVHFLGEHADPQSVLRGGDVFVLPSWAESFPYVILEAMSMGLAVIASDVGGIAEAIVHGESGLLVAPADHAALARAMLALLDDEALRRRLGEVAKSRVRQRFTRAAMIGDLVNVYEEVLSGSRGA
jgi:glycosyltransferase involved in cell wall biosynthesis